MINKIDLSLIGQGFGSANRISEVIQINQQFGYYFIPMVESAGLSIFHEQGFFGVIYFFILISGSIYLSLNYQTTQKSVAHIFLIFYLFLNAMATPVITGYSGLILTYFIILNPLIDYYKNRSYE
jgi:hypothetical protein